MGVQNYFFINIMINIIIQRMLSWSINILANKLRGLSPKKKCNFLFQLNKSSFEKKNVSRLFF